ncbi:MAG: HupE/UreJ family protein [Pseudomonadota bacterium]
MWVAILLTTPAFAHSGGEGFGGGFVSGFLHPIFGWDHVLAMVAVGLWGAFLGAPAIWLLPVAFPLMMAIGGALGVLGVPVPAVEQGIAASSIVLGILIALAARLPLVVALIIVAAFAIFHGHAHGTELPDATNAIAYSIGFVIATGLLHLGGIVFGLLTARPAGAIAVRGAGAAIAVAGAGFLTGYL